MARAQSLADLLQRADTVSRLGAPSDTFRDKVRFLRAEAARASRDGNAIRISAFLFTVHLTESRAAGEARKRADEAARRSSE
jgi:hypothetical protein